jgi:amino acid transporter
MTETIRDRINRRRRRSLAAASIGVAVIAAAAVLGWLLANADSGRYQPALLGVGIFGLVILSGGLLYLDLVRCPKCLGRVGPALYSRRTNYCPQCGVSLDIPAY